MRGHWRLRFEDGPETVLNPGDTALVDPGQRHALAPSMTGEASLYRVVATEDPAGLTGRARCDPPRHPRRLPAPLARRSWTSSSRASAGSPAPDFDAVMTEAVSEVVRRQVEAGIDVVSDGETSKISYATYVKDRYTGFSGDSPRNAPADLKLFPTFMQRLSREGGTPQYARPQCTGEVRSRGQGELGKDIANLQAAMAEHGAGAGFMNAASPGVISLFLQNAHYPTREAYLAALADAMRDEYRTIVEAGLDLQVDCPDLALSRHMLFTDLSDDEFVRIAETHVEALNHALDGLPEDRVRVHICWGNYEGPHVCDIDMAKVFPTLMKVRASQDPVRDRQPPPRPRMDRVPRPRARDPRHQGAGARRRGHHHQLRRAPRARGPAAPALRGHRRARPRHGGLGLRLRHLRGLRRGGPGDRLGQARHPQGGRAAGGMTSPRPPARPPLRRPAVGAAGRGPLRPTARSTCRRSSARDTVEALAARILAEAPPRFALAGLSMGGIVAMEVLRQAPERVERLALLDTNPLPEAEAAQAARRERMARVAAGALDAVVMEEMKPLYLAQETADGPRRADLLDLCLAMAREPRPRGLPPPVPRADAPPRPDRDLAAFGGPALVLMGEEDRLCPRDRHELMARLMPQAELVVVPGAGHLPPLERPRRSTPPARARLASALRPPPP